MTKDINICYFPRHIMTPYPICFIQIPVQTDILTYFQKLGQHRKTNSSNIRINQVTLSHPFIYKLNTDITAA